MPRISLTTRTFFFSFVPVCVVLTACFVALTAGFHQKIKRGLREQLEASDALLNRAAAGYLRRTAALVGKLTDSAGLKAAAGLLAETHHDPALASQARRTIEVQIRDLQASSSYDFVAVTTPRGETVAAVPCRECADPKSLPSLPSEPGLAEIQGALFQIELVPIRTAGEDIAHLVLGTRFDLNRLALPGDAVLLHGSRIVASTFPPALYKGIESQIARNCPAAALSCETLVGNETYIVSRLRRAQIGRGYRLLGFRSLDRPLHDFTASFLLVLAEVGMGGMLLAVLCAIITSRSVSRPIRALVSQLTRSEASGGMSQHLTAANGVRELVQLTGAYNRVADSERRSRLALESAKDSAVRANRLKDEFLANVSHELRTPLNGVLGMTDLLLQTPLDQDQRDYALTARNSGESLVTIIDDILNFSQLQTGKLELKLAPFDLRNLVMDAASAIRRDASAKGIQVSVFHSSSAPDHALGDELRVRQVLMHLCENAVKFTERGHIHIRVDPAPESGNPALVRMSVRDTGIGVAPGMAGLIFDSFTQADGSLTRRRGGTGLGLAIVKALAQKMGGQSGVNSQLCEGSEFWFTAELPAVAQDSASGSQPEREVWSHP